MEAPPETRGMKNSPGAVGLGFWRLGRPLSYTSRSMLISLAAVVISFSDTAPARLVDPLTCDHWLLRSNRSPAKS